MQELFQKSIVNKPSTVQKEKLAEALDFHNFVLTKYFSQDSVDSEIIFDSYASVAEDLKPMVADVVPILEKLQDAGDNILFEGAQGSLLDVDLGTYPYVTSSNTTASSAGLGSGLGPKDIDYVLGIAKAYTTRVGEGPFPTELMDSTGETIAKKGNESISYKGSSFPRADINLSPIGA